MQLFFTLKVGIVQLLVRWLGGLLNAFTAPWREWRQMQNLGDTVCSSPICHLIKQIQGNIVCSDRGETIFINIVIFLDRILAADKDIGKTEEKYLTQKSTSGRSLLIESWKMAKQNKKQCWMLGGKVWQVLLSKSGHCFSQKSSVDVKKNWEHECWWTVRTHKKCSKSQ